MLEKLKNQIKEHRSEILATLLGGLIMASGIVLGYSIEKPLPDYLDIVSGVEDGQLVKLIINGKPYNRIT